MTNLYPRRLVLCLLATLPAVLGAPLRAQAVPPATGSANTDAPVQLSPFVINGEDDEGYRATSTLAGTRIRTDLKDVGSAISVVTEKFLRDVGARNAEDLLVYTTNTEVAGLQGNMSGVVGQSQTTPNEAQTLLRPNTNTRVRGLQSADNTRDYFLTDIPWDSYNVGRVDLQRGPNSILFGQGQPSGIINASLNQAAFKNSNRVENRFGSFGSLRDSVDLNRVLLENELAVRISALDDETKYRQKPAYNRDRRIYGALRYDPQFLARNGAKTSFHVDFEAGDIRSNRPRALPPIDRITPWFRTGTVDVNNPAGTRRTVPALNRMVYDNWDAWNFRANVPGSTGARNATIRVNNQDIPNPNFQPGIAEFYTAGSFLFYPDPTSSSQATTGVPSLVGESSKTTLFGIGPSGAIDRNVNGIPFARFLAVANPFQTALAEGRQFPAQWKDYSLTDPSVFDFYHRLLDGPSKQEWRKFDALDAGVSQTFFDNRLGFDATFDHQRYRDGQDVILEGRQAAITVDVNATLMDNSPNPNAGRPMVISRTQYGSGGRQTERKSARVTVFGEVRATDVLAKSWVSDLLGRHVFTGLYSRDRYDVDDRQWARFLLDEGYSQITGQSNAFDPREVGIMSYLGPDMRNLSSPAGLNLPNLTASQSPTSAAIRYFDSHWKQPTNPAAAGYVNPAAPWTNPFSGATQTQADNPANYGGWTTYNARVLNSQNGDLPALTRYAQKNRNEITAKALVWQGFFADGTIVPTLGYREDTNKIYTVSAPSTSHGNVDTSPAAYSFPADPRDTLKTTNWSRSLVVHAPAALRRHLPFGANVSLFFNKSSNFAPVAGRVDLLGNPISAPTGSTKDYGFVISAFDDRLSLKVNWYQTRIQNAAASFSGAYWVGSMESRAWVAAKRFQAGLSGDPKYAGQNFNYGQTVNGVFVQSAQDRAQQQADVDAVLAAFPDALFKAWAIPTTDAKWNDPANWDTNAPWGRQPPGYTVTQDLATKGEEFELLFNPTRNWTITANASKTTAVSANNLGDIASWVEARNKVWQGEAGQIRLFGGAPSAQKVVDNWNATVYGPYLLETSKNNLNVAELRPWRFNVVTNYTFDRGFVRGLSVGGAYRWEDRAAIGYPGQRITRDGITIDGYDVGHPVLGPSDSSIDLWVGYARDLTAGIRWHVQLNVRNAFGKNELVPITIQPDGTYATYRIKDGPTWAVTNTFTF